MENNRDTFTPQKTLRQNPLKRALKAFLVGPLLKKYIVCSVRVLWKNDEDFNDMYEKRRLLEGKMKAMEEVVMLVNCITAMKPSDGDTKVGFAFWVVFDFAESQSNKLEDQIVKTILEAGLDVDDVTSIRARGKKCFI